MILLLTCKIWYPVLSLPAGMENAPPPGAGLPDPPFPAQGVKGLDRIIGNEHGVTKAEEAVPLPDGFLVCV